MFILCTLCIRIRNWCIRWACTQGTYAYAAQWASIRLGNPCRRWAYTSIAHACTEHAHKEACPLLSYSASFLFIQQRNELQDVLLNYTAPFWAMYTLLSYTAHCTMQPTPQKKVPNSPWRGNNDVITELFLPRGSLVSDIPAGDGKLVNLFLRCTELYAAPFWTTLHLLRNATSSWVTGHSTKLRCT
jgi:hypothetical protein